jgi:hypothetical protein
LAAVASRSFLIGALLRTAIPLNRNVVLDFLCGLSRDELECLADFQGASLLEEEYSLASHPYALMADFFDPFTGDRWHNPDDRAHKIIIVLAYLDHLQPSLTIRIKPKSFTA